MDLPYEGATLTNTQTTRLDRETSLELLEGSGLPPGV
jgi:branched-chain amino acid transport system substrate-binding protein